VSEEENMLARQAAEANHDLLREEALRFAGEARRRYWEKLAKLTAGELPAKSPPAEANDAPMDNMAARRFGATVMQFGKHVGKTIDSIPLEYLQWLDQQPETDFRKQLRRYMRSERIQAELRED
jgi:uncharacterized protein (DUF3820 family)